MSPYRWSRNLASRLKQSPADTQESQVTSVLPIPKGREDDLLRYQGLAIYRADHEPERLTQRILERAVLALNSMERLG